MNVLVDTSVWSLCLRRRSQPPESLVPELRSLIHEGRVVMIGPVRQELLSGIKSARHFRKLREHLRAFPDLDLSEADYEEAATCFNRCRAQGIQGSNTDFLICAVSIGRQLSVFTTDKDFDAYSRILSVPLHSVRS